MLDKNLIDILKKNKKILQNLRSFVLDTQY